MVSRDALNLLFKFVAHSIELFSVVLFRLEPETGIEPATACLQNRCSTVELLRQKKTPAFMRLPGR